MAGQYRRMVRACGLSLLALACLGWLDTSDARAQVPSGGLGSDRHLILEIQLALTELGYDPGAIDGNLSGQTESAILWFQTDRDLVRDGQATSALLDALRDAQRREVTAPQPLLADPGASSPGPADEAAQGDQPIVGDGTVGSNDAGLYVGAQPAEIAGTAEVLDTANLTVGGRALRLSGILAESRPDLIQGMASYIRSQGGGLTCERVDRGYRCITGLGYDLAEAALYNGAAQTTPGAPDLYLRAEQNARVNRVGRWR